jgi:hypothetical protein
MQQPRIFYTNNTINNNNNNNIYYYFNNIIPPGILDVVLFHIKKRKYVILCCIVLVLVIVIIDFIWIRPEMPRSMSVLDIINAYDSSSYDEKEYFTTTITTTTGTSSSTNNKKKRVLCVFLKNKARFVKEWIDFHLMIGWTNVMLFDDSSTDDVYSVVKPYGKDGMVEYIPANWSGSAHQVGQRYLVLQYECYNKCFDKHWKDAQIIATTDVDEFVYPCVDGVKNKLESFDSALSRYSAPYGEAIVAQMQCFRYGINGHLKPHNGSLLKTYPKRAAYENDVDYQLPTEISKRCDEMPFQHFCDRSKYTECYSCKRLYFPNGKRTKLFPNIHDFWGKAIRMNLGPYRNVGFCCNHYFFLSYEDVLNKYKTNGFNEVVDTVNQLTPDDIVWKFYESIQDQLILKHFESHDVE